MYKFRKYSLRSVIIFATNTAFLSSKNTASNVAQWKFMISVDTLDCLQTQELMILHATAGEYVHCSYSIHGCIIEHVTKRSGFVTTTNIRLQNLLHVDIHANLTE